MTTSNVDSYNAGYHRGLHTENHGTKVQTLYDEWAQAAYRESPSFSAFRDGYINGVADYSDGADGIRWFCENCDHVNAATTTYFEERAEAVGSEVVDYNSDCDVCHREVWDVREQRKAV